MADCIFCRIVKGEIPSKKIYEDEHVLVFHDVNPAAPIHYLAIPKEHICSANDIGQDNSTLMADIFEAIAKTAKETGIAADGYRIANNCGKNGMQTVEHLHFHVLGGRSMQWPPG